MLTRQCLKERMDTQQNIQEQAKAWQERRNAAQAKIEWRFGVQEARCKLKRLYPNSLPG